MHLRINVQRSVGTSKLTPPLSETHSGFPCSVSFCVTGKVVVYQSEMYFAPPQIELFCISVSWMCNQSLTPPFASLRLRVKLITQRCKVAKARKNKTPHVGDHVVWASRALVAVHSWSDRPYKKRSLCRVPEYSYPGK